MSIPGLFRIAEPSVMSSFRQGKWCFLVVSEIFLFTCHCCCCCCWGYWHCCFFTEVMLIFLWTCHCPCEPSIALITPHSSGWHPEVNCLFWIKWKIRRGAAYQISRAHYCTTRIWIEGSRDGGMLENVQCWDLGPPSRRSRWWCGCGTICNLYILPQLLLS